MRIVKKFFGLIAFAACGVLWLLACAAGCATVCFLFLAAFAGDAASKLGEEGGEFCGHYKNG